MAKVNKYLLQGKKTKAQLHIDLQQIALEYEKLLNKKFAIISKAILKQSSSLKWRISIIC